jgi:hypothetical protein
MTRVLKATPGRAAFLFAASVYINRVVVRLVLLDDLPICTPFVEFAAQPAPLEFPLPPNGGPSKERQGAERAEAKPEHSNQKPMRRHAPLNLRCSVNRTVPVKIPGNMAHGNFFPGETWTAAK